MNEDRIIKLNGISNIRDLGGLVGLDGRKIVKNRLIRSSRLLDLQADGYEYFKKINLTLVIDMRAGFEADNRPDPEIEGVKNVRISVLGEKKEDMGMTAGMVARSKNADEESVLVELIQGGFDMGKVYKDIINMPCAIEGMGAALKLIAAQPEDEAVLWHCNGGKDRTGTLTAFLLSILGVSKEDILDDFEMTNIFYQPEIDRLKAKARSMTDDPRVIESMQDIAGVSRANMEKAYEKIDAECGSVLNYITDKLKLTDDEIKSIRDKYLEKTTTEE